MLPGAQMRSIYADTFCWLTCPPGQTRNSGELSFCLFGSSICFAGSLPTHHCHHGCLLLAVEGPTVEMKRQFSDMVSQLTGPHHITSPGQKAIPLNTLMGLAMMQHFAKCLLRYLCTRRHKSYPWINLGCFSCAFLSGMACNGNSQSQAL